MANSLAQAVHVHVRREGFTVFERVVRVARRSPARPGLVAAFLVSMALGLFGTLVVLPPLAQAADTFGAGSWIHNPHTPAACTACEVFVPGDELVQWAAVE